MFFQSELADINWIIGLAIALGLAFGITYLLNKGYKSFFGFLLIFIGFSVYGGLLDFWLVVLLIIVNSIIIILEFNSRRTSE